MKRLLFLTLLIMQGLWGGEAAADVVEASTTQTEYPLVFKDDQKGIYLFPGPFLTLNNLIKVFPNTNEPTILDNPKEIYDLAFSMVTAIDQNPNKILPVDFFQDAVLQTINDPEKLKELLVTLNFLDPVLVGASNEDPFGLVIKAIYIGWLNADSTRPIVVKQNLVQACQQMGIVNVPVGWSQVIVDVTEVLDNNGIKNLDGRLNSISWLVYNNRMPEPFKGGLNLSHQNLGVFDVWNIPNASVLTYLDLSDNQLATLAPDTFVGLSSLYNLDLSHNQLATLAPDTFAGLSSLQNLYLSDNQLTDLAPGAFAGLSSLEGLDLSHNQLTAFAPGTFAGLSSLQGLLLSSNKLTTLTPGTFVGLSSLQGLDLSDNQLATLAPDTFVGLSSLYNLHLSDNQLATLAPDTFAGLYSLEVLHLSHNQLTMFAPGVFYGLGSLSSLNLENNQGLGLFNSHGLYSIKNQRPEWFRRPWVDDADDDQAVCPQCNQIGDACTCAAEGFDN